MKLMTRGFGHTNCDNKFSGKETGAAKEGQSEPSSAANFNDDVLVADSSQHSYTRALPIHKAW